MQRLDMSHRPRLFRVKALMLLAVFFAAGTSLPSLDALLYHHQGAELQRWQTHVEPAGGCVDHAGHCVLGRTAPGSGAKGSPAAEVRDEPHSGSALQWLPTQPAPHFDHAALPQQRAPPAHRS